MVGSTKYKIIWESQIRADKAVYGFPIHHAIGEGQVLPQVLYVLPSSIPLLRGALITDLVAELWSNKND